MADYNIGYMTGLNKPIKIPIKKVCKGYYLRWYYNGWHYWFFRPGKYALETQGEPYFTIGTRKISLSSGQITLSEIKAIRTILNTKEVYLLTVSGWMNIRVEPGSAEVYTNIVSGSEMELIAIIGSREISYDNGYSPVNNIPVVVPDLEYCEVIIGTQMWMCYNWDSNYPGSKAYNDEEGNAIIYGRLYDFNQIMSPGFIPAGWRIPTVSDWEELIVFCGGELVAGGVLKSIGLDYWNAPNTGAVDTYSFGARGAGYYDKVFGGGYYLGIKNYGYFLTQEYSGGLVTVAQVNFNNGQISLIDVLASRYMFSVRMVKDVVLPSITDIDGNIYHYVTIGTQQWLVENLRTTKYRDGTPIPNVTLDADWIAEDGTPGHDGAYCWYDNDIGFKEDYGAFYNWYAVNNVHGLAPAGWSVPTQADWETLITFLGGGDIGIGSTIGGGKLKEVGTVRWFDPNTGATDEYGFRARPSGERQAASANMGSFAEFWSATEGFPATNGRGYIIQNNAITFSFNNAEPKYYGFAVRCFRDI